MTRTPAFHGIPGLGDRRAAQPGSQWGGAGGPPVAPAQHGPRDTCPLCPQTRRPAAFGVTDGGRPHAGRAATSGLTSAGGETGTHPPGSPLRPPLPHLLPPPPRGGPESPCQRISTAGHSVNHGHHAVRERPVPWPAAPRAAPGSPRPWARCWAVPRGVRKLACFLLATSGPLTV